MQTRVEALLQQRAAERAASRLPGAQPRSSQEAAYIDDGEAPEAVLERLRKSLKRRGAEGIRGLSRHFRICDRNNNGLLDIDEFDKCCRINRLDLSQSERRKLFKFFDVDRNGSIAYNEFLRTVRGRLNPVRRALVKAAFDALDALNEGGPRGFLTIRNIEKFYSTSLIPAVKAGLKSRDDALVDYLSGFEGSEGNGDGKVNLEEWIRYYEEISSSIDEDDEFGQMMNNTWRHLKSGKKHVINFTPKGELELLEKQLREAIFRKKVANNPKRVLQQTFGVLDKNRSGTVDLDEFVNALEGFGMQVQGRRPGVGGLPMQTVRALFTKYDADQSGLLSISEFCDGLYAPEDRPATTQTRRDYYPKVPGCTVVRPDEISRPQTAAGCGSSRPGIFAHSAFAQSGSHSPTRQAVRSAKPCYGPNQWLKGSNHIFFP